MTPGKTHDDSEAHRHDDSVGDSQSHRQDGSVDDSQPTRQSHAGDSQSSRLRDYSPNFLRRSPDLLDRSLDLLGHSSNLLDPLASAVSAGTSVGTANDARSDVISGTPDDTAQFALLAVLPAVATLVGLALGSIFGFGVFDTRTPGSGRVVAYALLVPYFLLGVAGTHWLYEDATRLAAVGADWQPNPWIYVLGGGLVLELYYLAPVLNGTGPETGVVPYLAGGFVFALVLSVVVTGPVYVLQRRRHLDAH